MAEKHKGLHIAGTYTGDKVPKFTKWFYPFTGIFRDACYTLVGSFLLQYTIQTGVLSSDPAEFTAQYGVITIAMMIALIWDGINDPIMGLIVEKVHFKLGKYKPWILIGALGNALAVILMFLIRPTFGDGSANGWAYVGCMIAFYVLWDTFFTMNDIGYWAMLPSLTNDENERAHLTSRVTICAAIGAFIMTLGATFLPTLFINQGVGSGTIYGIMAIVVAVLFLVSQAAVFFFCQEKARDEVQEEKSEKSSLLDLFKIVGKNSEVRASVIGIFMYQLASTLITGGVGLNYFYLAMGYGSYAGGLVVSLISIFYVFAMLSSQALYPVIAQKMSKRKILTIGFIIAMVGALGFFLTCFPVFGDTIISTSLNAAGSTPRSAAIEGMDFGWLFGGLMFCNYLFPFIFFFGCGLIYMVILVMFQDSIDYNEWKFGERKESIISGWRPLDVKLAGAALRGIQFVIFLSAGVLASLDQIQNAESQLNSGEITAEQFTPQVDEIVNSVTPAALRTVGIWVIVLFVICLGVMYYFLRFRYKTTEEEHRKIVAELAARHEADAAAVSAQDAIEAKADAGMTATSEAAEQEQAVEQIEAEQSLKEVVLDSEEEEKTPEAKEPSDE